MSWVIGKFTGTVNYIFAKSFTEMTELNGPQMHDFMQSDL